MSNNQTTEDQLQDTTAEDLSEVQAEENATEESARMAPSEAEAASEALLSAAEQIEQLSGEVADLKDQLLREMAEMENLRRRSAKEKADASKYAASSFAKDMMSVGDNLDRAMQALPAEALEAASDEVKNLFAGIQMTNTEMLNVFERHGIKQVNPKGEKFDPNFHQAMFEVPNPELVAGTVTEVVQVGYAIGDRVLRPALVGVSKGGPKAAPKVEEAPQATDDGSMGDNVDTSA